MYVKHDYKVLYRSLYGTWSLESRASHDLPYQKQLIGPTLHKSVSSLIQSQTQLNLDPYYLLGIRTMEKIRDECEMSSRKRNKLSDGNIILPERVLIQG